MHSPDAASSHWASSTTTSTGRARAAILSRPTVATHTANRSPGDGGPSASAAASAAACGGGSSANPSSTGASRSDRAANASSASVSTPETCRTVTSPPHLPISSASRAVFPIPGSPRSRTVPHVHPAARPAAHRAGPAPRPARPASPDKCGLDHARGPGLHALQPAARGPSFASVPSPTRAQRPVDAGAPRPPLVDGVGPASATAPLKPGIRAVRFSPCYLPGPMVTTSRTWCWRPRCSPWGRDRPGRGQRPHGRGS